jgi:3-deoxy-7-phosphoheptulonate synthase
VIRPGADGIEFHVGKPVPQGAAALVAAFEGEGQVVMRVGVTRREANGRLVRLDRLGQPLQLIERIAQIEESQRVVGIGEGGAAVELAGAQFYRGGAYKPRTSPYAFQGLGEEALKIMAEIRDRFGLRIVTEAIDHDALELVAEYADVIQIGARNMQNFSLLKAAGRKRKPVLLKRGLAATLDEFLMAAEYIMSEGNYEVILCERGVRTFADHTRNTLDLSIVPAVQRLSHLPILVDPSHGTGQRAKVLPLSRAAIAVGADGLIIEVHDHPDKALSDGMQSILPEQFTQLMDECSQIATVLHRRIPRGIHVEESAGVPVTAR